MLWQHIYLWCVRACVGTAQSKKKSEEYYLDHKSLTVKLTQAAACTMCKPFQKTVNFKLEVGDVVRLMLDRNEPVMPEL